jgi:hypothetical protein
MKMNLKREIEIAKSDLMKLSYETFGHLYKSLVDSKDIEDTIENRIEIVDEWDFTATENMVYLYSAIKTLERIKDENI